MRPNDTATRDPEPDRAKTRLTAGVLSGRLTLMGGPDVETALNELIRRASRLVLRYVPAENIKALVLAGGYGRGEGGIRVDKGGEHPASNPDLILFSSGLGPADRDRLAAKVARPFASLRRRFGTGVDFSVIDARRLERDPVRLLWYDLRHGHKLLAGDPGFLPGLTRFTLGNIDPTDMADLVIKRGALLILNDLILAHEAYSGRVCLVRDAHLALSDLVLPQNPWTSVRREALLTHVVRAIIGCGDAFLLAREAYHWSYVERRRRMSLAAIPATPEFKTLYESAMRYRFGGDPLAGERLLAEVESGHLRKVLGAAHLEIERHRFRAPNLTFEGYVTVSLRQDLMDAKSSLGSLARGALTAVRAGLHLGAGSPYSLRLALDGGDERGAVRALFPLIAYGAGNAQDAAAAREILGVRNVRSGAARLAWLRMWSRSFDPNLTRTLTRLGLPVEAAA